MASLSRWRQVEEVGAPPGSIQFPENIGMTAVFRFAAILTLYHLPAQEWSYHGLAE
jgi:hypothetical protein